MHTNVKTTGAGRPMTLARGWATYLEVCEREWITERPLDGHPLELWRPPRDMRFSSACP